MTPLFEIPILKSVFLALYHIVALIVIYCFILCVMNKSKFKYKAASVLILAFITAKMITFMSGFCSVDFPHILSKIFSVYFNVPYLFFIVSFLIEFFAVLFLLYKIRLWQSNNITMMSVKEGTDKLPVGLCCCYENGMPILINHRMNEIARKITGEALLDGNEFWRRIYTGDIIYGCVSYKKGDNPIIGLDESNIRSFIRNEKIIDGKKIYEITASDITAQYTMIQQIKEYNSELDRTNRKLEQYSENLLKITREKEILSAKISIHDKIGKALLSTKRYILSGFKDSDKALISEMWRNNINLLRNGIVDNESDNNLDELYAAASIMGIKIEISGTLPEDYSVLRFIMSAARECMTNAVHHANAKTLFINIKKVSHFYIIEYKNDGDKPAGRVIEGGGLGTLRKNIESAGGFMSTESVSEFILKIKIPE